MLRRRSLLRLSLLTLFPQLFARAARARGASGPGRSERTISAAGVERRYILRVPTGYSPTAPIPLVLMLHGRGGSALNAERGYNWPALGERENFVLCFAEALPDRMGLRAWNAGYNSGQVSIDDVGFLDAVIAQVKSELKIDPDRVYVCGHSSGAMMSYRYGAERSASLAAIGVVAGSIGSTVTGRRTMIPKPAHPLSLIAFHGKADQLVPYDSGNSSTPGVFRPRFVPAPESVAFFVDADGCRKTPERVATFGGNIVRETFAGGRDGTDVIFYTIGDGSHMWPGGRSLGHIPLLGEPNHQIDATQLMWDFFKAHPRR